MNQITTKYLIVGQGIAGSMLGHFLDQAKQSFCFVDAPQLKSCTSVAAGIINPITGRRFVKSWRIDDFYPFAKSTYEVLEETLNETFFHAQPIVRSLFNHGEENTWHARFAESGYRPYMVEEPTLGTVLKAVKPAFAYAEIAQTAQVHIGKLCDRLRKKYLENDQLVEEKFDFEQLELLGDKVTYKNITADKIIFCEGWRGQYNPYFKHLPFQVTKGEVLHIQLPEVSIDRMYKHGPYIVPFGQQTYWIGATSEHDFVDEEPTDKNKKLLESRLEQMLDTPYKLTDHKAAIRPTVKDRRPFIGKHLDHQQLFIFNGMGTKGASLAPFWAKHFVDHLVNGQNLDREVDIQRFDKK